MATTTSRTTTEPRESPEDIAEDVFRDAYLGLTASGRSDENNLYVRVSEIYTSHRMRAADRGFTFRWVTADDVDEMTVRLERE